MSLCLLSPSLCTHGLSSLHPWNSNLRFSASTFRICATADGDEPTNGLDIQPPDSPFPSDLKKVVNKTAATFAPRASTASKNPAVPGTTLYKVFEVQGYASMLLGGVLSFNLLFPSNEPDLWRLMGMWSIWMFSKSLLPNKDVLFFLSFLLSYSWQPFLLSEHEIVQVKRKRPLTIYFSSSLCSMLLYPSFGNPLLLSGLLIHLPSLQSMPGRYASFTIRMLILGRFFLLVFFLTFLPLTTAWMAGKNRVDELRMGLENQDSSFTTSVE